MDVLGRRSDHYPPRIIEITNSSFSFHETVVEPCGAVDVFYDYIRFCKSFLYITFNDLTVAEEVTMFMDTR